MQNKNIEEALRLYKKHNYADGGALQDSMGTLKLEQMKPEEPEIVPPLQDAPLNINKEVAPSVSLSQPVAPETEGAGTAIAKGVLPTAAGAIGTAFGGPAVGAVAAAGTSALLNLLFADGGMVPNNFAGGGDIGSLAALTNAIENKPQFPQVVGGNETKHYNPVPIKPIEAMADGGEAGSVGVETTKKEGLEPVAELPPVPEPPPQEKKRVPLAADTEAEGRASELEKVLREVGADKELDEGAKAYLRDQAFADAAKRGLPASALRANYVSRKSEAIKSKAAPKADASNEAVKAPAVEEKAKVDTTATQAPAAAPAAPAPKAEVPTDGAALRNKTIGMTDALGRGPVAVINNEVAFAQEVGDKAYAQYQKTRAQVLSDLGVNVAPKTPQDFAKNRELFGIADNIAKTTARQYATLFAAPEVAVDKSKVAPVATTTTTEVAPTSDTTTPVVSTTTTPAVGTPAVEKKAVGRDAAVSYLKDAAVRAGMKNGAAIEAFANDFADRLAPLDAAAVIGEADKLIATDERAQAAISAGSELRKASTAKLAADLAIQEKSKALDDAAAALQGQMAVDVQRRLQTAQVQADRLRREILDDTRAADKYLKGSTPGAISSLMGIIGAGLGSQQSYQDWYGKRVREELATQYDLIGKKQTLMGVYLDQTKNLDDAYKLTEASIKRVLAAQTQAQLGSLLNEKAKQEAIMAAKKLELDAAKTEGDVINGVSMRQSRPLQDALEKARTDLGLAKEVLDTYQDDTIARLNAAAAGVRATAGARERAAERKEEKAGPPAWGKALRGDKLTDADIEEIGKWDDKKRAQIVPVLRPVKTTEKINGKTIDVYSLAPSPGLHTLARSDEGAKKVNASDINTANMMRAWNTMSRLGAKHNYSKVGLESNGEDKAAYADAIQAIIAGYSELRNTGVISGGEYERYKSQADNVDLTSRPSVAASAFTSFNKTLAESNAAVRSNYLQKPSSGATSVDISAIPSGHIRALQANKGDSKVRADFDSKYGKGAAAAALGE